MRHCIRIAAFSFAAAAWMTLAPSNPQFMAHADQPPAMENADTGDLGISHVGCSLFGAHRDEYLKVGLGADLAEMSSRAAITQRVAAALPATGSMPSRSRVSRRQTAQLDLSSADSIDEFILATLELRGIPPAPVTTDTEFLRRITLDLAGRIPTAAEVIAFLSNPSPNKRAETIDRLLESDGWVWRWAMFFGDLYRNTRATVQVNRYPDGRDAFHLYLLQSLKENKPYDQMAREMLAASGVADGRTYPASYSSFEEYLQIRNDYQNNPVTPTPASYVVGSRMTGGPIQDTFDSMAAIVARDFLGVTHMDCVLCHDGAGHLESLSVWGAAAKRKEGWQLAAFFAQSRLQAPPRTPPRDDGTAGVRPPYWYVADLGRNGYRLNTTSGNRPERLPNGADDAPLVEPYYAFSAAGPGRGEAPREAAGRLLTADPQFAKAIVNYIWKELFGRGIVEPADQFDLGRLDPANPPPGAWTVQPSHPGLLDQLAGEFASNGFDLKWLMREIANSRAYQFSSRYEGAWNPQYEPYFARHQARRLGAEQLHDSLVVSSGIATPYNVSPTFRNLSFTIQFPDVQGIPGGGRQGPGNFNTLALEFLDAFFRGDREETARSSDGSILQSLQMMNNPLVLSRVSAGAQQGAVAALLAQPDDVLVQGLYLRILSRPATAQELAFGVQLMAQGPRSARAEDLAWSLYNKIEFLFNY